MKTLWAALPLAVLLAGCSAKFDDTNLAKLKEEISKQAASKGYQVTAIDVKAESDVKAKGEAKLINPKFPGQIVTWECSADMGKDNSFEYRCKPLEIDMLKEKIRETIAAQKLTVAALDLTRQPNGDYTGSATVADPAAPGQTAKWACNAALDPGTSGDTANFKWSCKP